MGVADLNLGNMDKLNNFMSFFLSSPIFSVTLFDLFKQHLN